ncbi:core-binding factor subunit beta isoform X4 [Bubalus kerabau]|uniref:core-binding factor subunit beta isoform X4 n=1 Tax=Bubalus carabanensis TaxID=3119969 RepID=UPI00244ED61B|nr:core-binding factor subunit beta isoform X4 [Bubalus carabanensis]
MMRVQLDLFSLFPPLVFDVHSLHSSWSVFGISKDLSFQRRLWSLLQSLQGLKFPGVQVTIWGYSALLGSPKVPGSVEEGLARTAPYLQERGRSPTERSGRPGEKGPRGAAGGAGFRCSPAAPQADLRRMRGACRRVVNGGWYTQPMDFLEVIDAFVATGTNLSLQFFPASWQGEQRQTPSREYVDFEREAGKQEDALAQQAFEEARRRTREFEDRDRSHREEMEVRVSQLLAVTGKKTTRP